MTGDNALFNLAISSRSFVAFFRVLDHSCPVMRPSAVTFGDWNGERQPSLRGNDETRLTETICGMLSAAMLFVFSVIVLFFSSRGEDAF